MKAPSLTSTLALVMSLRSMVRLRKWRDSSGSIVLVNLLLTGWGVERLHALTVTYTYSILQSFFLNRVWSYRDDGPAGRAFSGTVLLIYRAMS